MNIPAIIHQTWKTENVPPTFTRFMNTWKDQHASWEHRLWTDEMNRAFIATNYPAFLETYDAFETNIQRVDAARYFILYHYGGLYVDLDFECLKNIEPLLQNAGCVFGREPDEHCAVHGKQMIISNAFIACTPRHSFIEALCREVSIRKRKRYSRNDRILESTGPFMVTRLYEQFKEKHQVTILPYDTIYPLTKKEISARLKEKENAPAASESLPGAYAIHHYYGTWWAYNKKRTISILGFKLRF